MIHGIMLSVYPVFVLSVYPVTCSLCILSPSSECISCHPVLPVYPTTLCSRCILSPYSVFCYHALCVSGHPLLSVYPATVLSIYHVTMYSLPSLSPCTLIVTCKIDLCLFCQHAVRVACHHALLYILPPCALRLSRHPVLFMYPVTVFSV